MKILPNLVRDSSDESFQLIVSLPFSINGWIPICNYIKGMQSFILWKQKTL
jgi:hypothetical protein